MPVSLLSHNDVNARQFRWKASNSRRRKISRSLPTGNQYDPRAVRRKISPGTNLHSGDCYQVNLAQRFHATYSGDEWQAFLQLNQANRAPFSAFYVLNRCNFKPFARAVLML